MGKCVEKYHVPCQSLCRNCFDYDKEPTEEPCRRCVNLGDNKDTVKKITMKRRR